MHILYGSKPRVRGRASRLPNAEALPIILSFFFFFRFGAADPPALRSRSLRLHDDLLGRFRGQLGQSHVCLLSLKMLPLLLLVPPKSLLPLPQTPPRSASASAPRNCRRPRPQGPRRRRRLCSCRHRGCHRRGKKKKNRP